MKADPLLLVGKAFTDTDKALLVASTDVDRDSLMTEWTKLIVAAAQLHAGTAAGRRVKAAMMLMIVHRIGDTTNQLFADLAVSLASDILLRCA